MKRVYFVNRFYWPETPATAQLLTDLASALAANGLAVTVVTARSSGSSRPDVEFDRGVEILRVGPPGGIAKSIPAKARFFAGFALAAMRTLRDRLQKDDVVVTLTDPPLLGLATTDIARRRGAKIVHWLQDVYPEVAHAVSGNPAFLLLRPFRNRAWRQSDACVALHHEMADVVRTAGMDPSRITVCSNWAPAGLTHDASGAARLRHEWGLEDRFVITYSGNMGRVHDMESIVAGARMLRDDPHFIFVFIGGGPRLAVVTRGVARHQLVNVRFMPGQPRELLGATLSAADLHLVSLQGGCQPFVFPSKVYGVAAVGRPLLYIGPPGELEQVIAREQLGRSVRGGDPVAFANAVRALADAPAERERIARAATNYAHRHSHSAAVAHWRALLQSLGAC